MSTKIYYAVKVNAEDFEHFCDVVIDADVAAIMPTVKNRMAYITHANMLDFYKTTERVGEIGSKQYLVHKLDMIALRAAAVNETDHTDNLNCGWVICYWHPDLAFYCYSYGQNTKNSHAQAIAIENVNDFSYWDNADGPDDVDVADWYERREIWSKLRLTNKMFLQTVDFTSRFMSPIYNKIFKAIMQGNF